MIRSTVESKKYCLIHLVVTATFLTEDSYLGSLTEPLTLNRYNYCVSSYKPLIQVGGKPVLKELDIPVAADSKSCTFVIGQILSNAIK